MYSSELSGIRTEASQDFKRTKWKYIRLCVFQKREIGWVMAGGGNGVSVYL